jgi:hypothetical protein
VKGAPFVACSTVMSSVFGVVLYMSGVTFMALPKLFFCVEMKCVCCDDYVIANLIGVSTHV